MSRRAFLAGLAGIAYVTLLPFLPASAQTGVMSDDEFWALIDLIDGSKWDDATSDVTSLIAALAVLPEDKIEAFYSLLGDKALALATQEHYSAYSWFPGLSDSFLYARLAVIANGRETYESVLKDPRKFPGWSADAWFERPLYVCDDAYRIATGRVFARPGSEKFEVMIR